MKPQGKKRDALVGAIDFLVVTTLGLIVGLLSNGKAATFVTSRLVAAFVALLATGAVLEYARRTAPAVPGHEEVPPGEPGPVPDPVPRLPPRRTVKSVLLGAFSGVLAGALLVFMFGPGGLGTGTSGASSPTASTAPALPSDPAATPASTALAGEPVVLSATPGDGRTEFGPDITVTVTASRVLPSGDTYWLIVEFVGGTNTVYKAEGKVPAAQHTSNFSLSIAGAAIGSTRTIYILEADSQATPELVQNLANPQPSWDGNRTSLPSGVARISNSVTVVKQVS